jgi:uncharacterized membrane protein YkoI
MANRTTQSQNMVLEMAIILINVQQTRWTFKVIHSDQEMEETHFLRINLLVKTGTHIRQLESKILAINNKSEWSHRKKKEKIISLEPTIISE